MERRQAGIQLTFQSLAKLLDLEPNTVQAVIVDYDSQTIKVIHNDENEPLYDLGEVSVVPYRRMRKR